MTRCRTAINKSTGAWIHQTWSHQQSWDGPDGLIVDVRSRGFGFEFAEEKHVEG
jgi:hypothetical protein